MTRAYCIKFLIAASLLIIGTALINLIADPYSIWKTPLIRGVNDSKSSGDHSRIQRYVEWAQWTSPPRTILLGTSRTADGLRADHPLFKNETTYNMALGGQPAHETLVLFKHALKSKNLHRAVIGLDFFAFNEYWAKGVVDEKRLIPSPNLDLLFNASTLTDSLATLSQKGATHADDGIPMGNPAGHHAIPMHLLFTKVEKIFVTYHRPLPYHLYSYSNPKTGENTLDDFRELLRIAYANDIELHLFISPSHAWHWEGLANIGLWENWEQWKRELVRINRTESDKAGKKSYPLWDFSGYNRITTETVPAPNALTRMKWYSDSSHYNKACGDLILDRMLGHDAPSIPIPDDFGILIDDQNIGDWLSDIRKARKNYADSHALDIQEMVNLSRLARNH